MAFLHLLNYPDEFEKLLNAPAQSYVRDTKAAASTAVDVKELPNSYVFVADMPGVKSANIKVQVESDNVLVISGERKREEVSDDTQYIKVERSAGKFLRKFTLPGNANVDDIMAACQDGVLTVTVNKIPPPEPKKPKIIDIKVL